MTPTWIVKFDKLVNNKLLCLFIFSVKISVVNLPKINF